MKLYNIGAYGIPAKIQSAVRCWDLDLTWSGHAREELLNLVMNLKLDPSSVAVKEFFGNHWEIVEVETDQFDRPSKVVARREVNFQWSLVLVVQRNGLVTGTVKTCWANLNTDNHRTLNLERFSNAAPSLGGSLRRSSLITT